VRRPIVGILAVTLFLFVFVAPCFADLKEYVNRPDDSFSYSIDSVISIDSNTAYLVNMTSQTWQGITWKHWVIVMKPAVIKHPDKALLLISGGSNRSTPPKADSKEARAVSLVANRLGAVVAVVLQVPNQPLFDGKREDAIISYTYEKFLNGEGDDWPLLLPMVKSAVRAMDTVQGVAKYEFGQDIRQFVVTGASKRGWTTWLTAATGDPRVYSIAPMVIDVLNMGPQMEHQMKVYGAYSNQIDDYTERGIQDYITSPKGKKLLRLVDPYSYRDEMTQPKLIIMGTNDEYWTIDAARFYFDNLKGDNYLHYEPNAGHGLNLNIVPVITAFFNAALTGEPLPKLEWDLLKSGKLKVKWDRREGEAALWKAVSPNRDFRPSPWTETPLKGKRGVRVKLETPDEGWAAYYVAVTFPMKIGDSSLHYPLCTRTYVVPDTFPEH